MLRLLATLVLCFAYLQLVTPDIESLTTDKAIEIVLVYRAFNKLFHCPGAAALDSLILLTEYKTPVALTLTAFGLNRLFIFINKCIYVVVSVITAMKNKKQRFANQGLIFFL